MPFMEKLRELATPFVPVLSWLWWVWLAAVCLLVLILLYLPVCELLRRRRGCCRKAAGSWDRTHTFNTPTDTHTATPTT